MGDTNKNVGQLLGSSGSIVAKYEYSPFGKITSSSGTYANDNPFRFSSEYADNETGLDYYNYRYYSAELGRWLKRDRIEEDGGYNLYGMVENHPVGGWDLLGLKNISSCCDMVDDLVKIAESNNKWWKGPDWVQRALTANDIANRYAPDSMGIHRFAVGGNVTGGNTRNIIGHSGFRAVLTQGGQNNAVYRHIGFNAAAVVDGTTILSKIAETSEYIQAFLNVREYLTGSQRIPNIQTLMKESSERQAEIEGDKAGRNVGQFLNEFLDDEITKNELRKKLLKELCGCN